MASKQKRRAHITPRCIVIAGPNGAGKTTFAREFLPKDTDVIHFVNADLIASGLSTLRPDIAALTAGRVFLAELDRLARSRTSFAFETTLSGRIYAGRLAKWKAVGYRVEIVYLRISSPDLALKRIAARVKQGGHDVPRDDVVRRFSRSWINFVNVYQALADVWSVYDNSAETPRLLEHRPLQLRNHEGTARATSSLGRSDEHFGGRRAARARLPECTGPQFTL